MGGCVNNAPVNNIGSSTDYHGDSIQNKGVNIIGGM